MRRNFRRKAEEAPEEMLKPLSRRKKKGEATPKAKESWKQVEFLGMNRSQGGNAPRSTHSRRKRSGRQHRRRRAQGKP